MILKEKKGALSISRNRQSRNCIHFSNAETASVWAGNEHWQSICSNSEREINNKYPKSKKDLFIKRIYWILPYIVKGTPISGAPTFYPDANKTRKVGNKKEKNSSKSL